ncbi:MAG: antitoxin [Thiolinea sp.]
MAMMTVRNLPDEIYRALRVRAAQNGHSAEAEVRAILENAVKGTKRIKLGSMLAEIGQQAALTEEEFAELTRVRDKTTVTPLDFE